MAGNKSKTRRGHQEETRLRIKTTVIIEKMQRHVEDPVKTPMSSTQIRAAEILLKKRLPDLQSVELSGELTQNHMDDGTLNRRLDELFTKLRERSNG